ncbi:hypothetical protein BVX97_03740 [bacterium E08(2017)]|nr:hypothetical protein BVX97_03740 [bacterium E08(2017)]
MYDEPQSIMPVSLIIEDRQCMVVGGGQVALRKVESLMEAEARVTVVAPDVCEEIKELAHEGLIYCFEREFTIADVLNKYLVFAATNVEEVNAAVQVACHDRRVLCCRVDCGWRDGDFISPASFSYNDIIVSVSTGGSSLAEAKEIKNLVKAFLEEREALAAFEDE